MWKIRERKHYREIRSFNVVPTFAWKSIWEKGQLKKRATKRLTGVPLRSESEQHWKQRVSILVLKSWLDRNQNSSQRFLMDDPSKRTCILQNKLITKGNLINQLTFILTGEVILVTTHRSSTTVSPDPSDLTVEALMFCTLLLHCVNDSNMILWDGTKKRS